jgi:hypothetical protein
MYTSTSAVRPEEGDDTCADAHDTLDQQSPSMILIGAKGRDQRENAVDERIRAPEQYQHCKGYARPGKRQDPKDHSRHTAQGEGPPVIDCRAHPTQHLRPPVRSYRKYALLSSRSVTMMSHRVELPFCHQHHRPQPKRPEM